MPSAYTQGVPVTSYSLAVFDAFVNQTIVSAFLREFLISALR
jgi:hypothetical protein